MKRWTRPYAVEENLLADQNVANATCYRVGCVRGNGGTVPSADHWDGNDCGGGHAKYGTSGTCGDPEKNALITTGNWEVGTRIYEYNGEQGRISGTIDSWDDNNHNGIVDRDDTVYWHTNANKDSRQWNHWGVLDAASSNHPNRS